MNWGWSLEYGGEKIWANEPIVTVIVLQEVLFAVAGSSRGLCCGGSVCEKLVTQVGEEVPRGYWRHHHALIIPAGSRRLREMAILVPPSIPTPHPPPPNQALSSFVHFFISVPSLLYNIGVRPIFGEQTFYICFYQSLHDTQGVIAHQQNYFPQCQHSDRNTFPKKTGWQTWKILVQDVTSKTGFGSLTGTIFSFQPVWLMA